MKDGNKYYIGYFQKNVVEGETTTFTAPYSNYEHTEDNSAWYQEMYDRTVYVIDPSEIETIIVNGNTIYTSE